VSRKQPTNLDEFMVQIKREERIDRLTLVGLIVVVLLAVWFFGCGPAQRKPDHRPAPPARIEAHLTAMPPVTISGHLVTLVAWLDDPEAQIKCPTITWTWPNETRSSHTADCDPDEAVTRHQEIKQGVLSEGEYPFQVLFASAGREWRAAVTVEVH
jgi:hypothetical protein